MALGDGQGSIRGRARCGAGGTGTHGGSSSAAGGREQLRVRSLRGAGRGAWFRGRGYLAAQETQTHRSGGTARSTATDDDWEALGRRRFGAASASTAICSGSAERGGAGAVGSSRQEAPQLAGGEELHLAAPGAEAAAAAVAPPQDEQSPGRRCWRSGAARAATTHGTDLTGSHDECRARGQADSAEQATPTGEATDPNEPSLEATPTGEATDPSEPFPEAGGAPARSGRKAKGGAGKADGMPRAVRISKALTQVLRHKAPDLGVEIRPDGYCRLRDVLAVNWLLDLECTELDVDQVVKQSDKKRFDMTMEDGQQMIRAVQGHSIKVVQDEQLLRRLVLEDSDLPEKCVHGTYRRHYEKIRAGGLLAGGKNGQGFRKHIHFAPFDPFDPRVVSGMRFDCEVAIWIDMPRAMRDGLPFYMSANQVILSPGIRGHVDRRYFLRAEDLRTREELDLAASALARQRAA